MAKINNSMLEEELGILSDAIGESTDFVTPEVVDIGLPPVNEEDKIIQNNINRANNMLDRIEDEMGHDPANFNPRMIEVFSKLIDSVTTAASQIQSSTYNSDYLILRQKLAELKEYEVKAKVKNLAAGVNKSQTTIGSQNIIVTDRENILKIMREGGQLE